MNQPDNRSRAQIERAETLTERLKAILVELAEAPDASPIIFEAAGEAFNELSAQERHEGTLVRLLLDMARTAADAGVQEMENQEGFYIEEAEFEHSDHKPSDCRRWAREYARAAKAYQKTHDAIGPMGDALSKRLQKSGI